MVKTYLTKIMKNNLSGFKMITVILVFLIAFILSTCGGDDDVKPPNVDFWISLGPEGGTVSAIAIDPANTDTIYIGTEGGIFKSTDGGSNWNRVTISIVDWGVISRPAEVIAIDPVNTATIYAGMAVEGYIYKSTDGGANWTRSNMSLGNVIFNLLIIDPKNTNTLYFKRNKA